MPGDGRALFVTGTDTGVGKTVVTAAIAALAVATGRRTAVYKPAQTGVEPGAPGDLEFVRAAAGESPLLWTACAYRLREPLAPSVAARLEGTAIEPSLLAETYRRQAEDADVALVEGAGGLLVPLAGGYSMADLAQDLGLPVLVVARPGLGTLNHTALTAEVARARGLEVAGVVLCGFPPEPDLAMATNPKEIVRLTGAPLLGALPALPELDTERCRVPDGFASQARRWLAPELGGAFDAVAWVEALERSLSARGLLRGRPARRG
jgi:dethiobiotin synthetase